MRKPLSKKVAKIISRIMWFRKKKKPLVKRGVMSETEFDEAKIYI